MEPVKVTFEYDEDTRKWNPTVTGAVNTVEASQAFNAVVLTCRDVIPCLEHICTETTAGIEITPRVTINGLLNTMHGGKR